MHLSYFSVVFYFILVLAHFFFFLFFPLHCHVNALDMFLSTNIFVLTLKSCPAIWYLRRHVKQADKVCSRMCFVSLSNQADLF